MNLKTRRNLLMLYATLCSGFLAGSTASAATKPITPRRSVKQTERKDTLTGVSDTARINLIYNSAKPQLSAASTQTLSTGQLSHMPVTNVLNALVGQVAGLYTNQSSGSIISDQVSLSLRGKTPAIYVDGILRGDLIGFDQSEIETVTVLKDALAVATLGVRASNGAILITTKKGQVAKQIITFSANTSFQQSINVPRVLNAYQYASLYNEATANDGLPTVYSQADLDAYKNHTDPFGHPDVDWRDQILKKNPQFTQYVLNATGGSKVARYYVSLEHTEQNGIFNTSPANTYDTNNDFSRYLIRSNVDVNITQRLSAGINLFGSNYNVNYTGALPSQLLAALFTTPNNAYPVYNPNGSYAGNQQYQNNLQAGIVSSGYGQNYYRNVSANFYLRREMDDVLPGLWIKAVGSYYSTLREDIGRAKSFAVYQRNVSQAGTVTYQQFGVDGTQANTNGINYQRRYDYFELSAGYEKNIANTHNISLLLLGNRDNYVTGSDLPYTVQGLSGRGTYSYKQKYVVDFAFGFNGSNRYPPDGDYKYAFLPAAGLAWNMEKEDFLKTSTWISKLKLYASYGINANDNAGYFLYEKRYNGGATNYLGTGAGTQGTLIEPALPNTYRDYEKVTKLNAGINGSFLNDRLTFTAEYYNNRFYNLLIQDGTNSALLGNGYPDVNIGKQRYYGFDFQLGWQSHNTSGLNYSVSALAGLQSSKLLYSDEVTQPYPWMQRTGQAVGRPFGFVADGLFQNQAEINAAPKQEGFGYAPQPGDIRYKDLNGDGIINQFDQAPIGNAGPLISYGMNVSLHFKGFDFFALAQGVANRDFFLSGNAYYAFQNNGFGQAYEWNLGRWTPQTAATATYPRINVGFNDNNYRYSSYWMRSGNYLRLKNVELGYTLPVKLTSKVKLKAVRFYVGGTNLLTASSLEKGIDPEIDLGQFPVQRLYTLGADIKF